jgi:hypothetical protein
MAFRSRYLHVLALNGGTREPSIAHNLSTVLNLMLCKYDYSQSWA